MTIGRQHFYCDALNGARVSLLMTDDDVELCRVVTTANYPEPPLHHTHTLPF